MGSATDKSDEVKSYTPDKLKENFSAPHYHKSICSYFQRYEPKVWEWFSDLKVLEESYENSRTSLLKNTYRLSQDSHSKVYDLCKSAAARLNVNAPITLYQANDGEMNAALFYIPNEVHIVFYGQLLSKLSDIELTALFGHELSHYLLWSMDKYDYLIAQQLLEDSVARDPYNNAIYETSRLFALHTEIFADRGAVIASNCHTSAIAALIKVMTGLDDVDANAFLNQANELEARNQISDAKSHPELYLRALFIDRWIQTCSEDDKLQEKFKVDEWINEKLKGPLNIECLDVLDQIKLSEMTFTFFKYILDCSELADNADLKSAEAQLREASDFESEAVINQLETFFPDWRTRKPVTDIEELAQSKLERSTIDYFIALIFDIAHADREQTQEILQRGTDLSKHFGWLNAYRENLMMLLGLSKREAEKLAGKPDKKPSIVPTNDERRVNNER